MNIDELLDMHKACSILLRRYEKEVNLTVQDSNRVLQENDAYKKYHSLLKQYNKIMDMMEEKIVNYEFN